MNLQHKDIFDGRYTIFTDGRIFSLSRNVFIKQSFTGRDKKYAIVAIRLGEKQKNFYVHKLVAESFLDNPHNLSCVIHIDGDKKNNNIDNLRWGTRSEAMFLAHKNGDVPRYVCTKCGHVSTLKCILNACPKCTNIGTKKYRKRDKKKDEETKIFELYSFLLSDKDKRIIEYEVNGMTYREVADILNVSHQAAFQIIRQIKVKWFSQIILNDIIFK